MKFKGFVHAVIAGHGGVDEHGEYQILKKGTKQANVDGTMIYEGEQNRHIRDRVMSQSSAMGLKVIDLVPEINDITLGERVRRINANYNQWEKQGYRLLVWELHLNAFNGQASGTEIFTTRGNNFSDVMAKEWWDVKEKLVSDYKGRPDYSDGDPDKEADFYVIKNSKAYATLIEFFFFDHPDSVKKFCNENGWSLWAKTVVEAMKVIEEKYDPTTLKERV